MKESGFTIIEIIITLIVAGVMASMMYPFFSRQILFSANAIYDFQKYSGLEQVAANVLADYENQYAMNTSASAFTNFKTRLTTQSYGSNYTLSIGANSSFPSAADTNAVNNCIIVTLTRTGGGASITLLLTPKANANQ